MYTLNVFNLNNKNSARKRNPLSSALILISTQLYFTLTMYACSRSRSRGSMLSVSFWRNASAFRLGLWILNIFSSLLHIVGSIEELTFSLFPIKDQFRSVLKIILIFIWLSYILQMYSGSGENTCFAKHCWRRVTLKHIYNTKYNWQGDYFVYKAI